MFICYCLLLFTYWLFRKYFLATNMTSFKRKDRSPAGERNLIIAKSKTIHDEQGEAFSKLVIGDRSLLLHNCLTDDHKINIDGAFCWKYDVGQSPQSHAFLTKLEKQFFCPTIVIKDCQVKIQPLYKSSNDFAADSRYNLTGANENDMEIDERSFYFQSLTKFNSACQHIFAKVINPANTVKHKNVDAGIINPVSWTRLNLVPSIDVMYNVGQHWTCFERFGKTPDAYKYAKKTLDSVRKAFRCLIEIGEIFYAYDCKEFTDIVGNSDANEAVFKRNVFTINFDEGFFAEGKTSRLNLRKYAILEIPLFIRGVPTFADCNTLMLSCDDDERNIINTFINNASHIMVAMKIFNLVRSDLVDSDIYIDRGLFSRLYFQHFEMRGSVESNLRQHSSISQLFNGFYGPMAMYFDMIQANFYTPIKVNFIHNFYMNSLRVSDRNWRDDDEREYERRLYPTREIEIAKRRVTYKTIFYTLPNIINMFTNEEMVQSYNVNNTVDDFNMTFNQNMISKDGDRKKD